MKEANPFTNPRDANLAAAWVYGSKIGKRRERILLALGGFVGGFILFALATCATAPVSFASKRNAEVYNLRLRFDDTPGYWQYKRAFTSYKDCYDFATGRIFQADMAMIRAANPKATLKPSCGVEVD